MDQDLFLLNLSLERLFLLVFILFIVERLPTFSQQAETRFTIKGKLRGSDARVIYLGYHINKDQQTVSDSAIISKKRFLFKGTTYEPTVAHISLNRREAGTRNDTYIFLEPSNMGMVLKADRFEEVRLKGSKTQRDQQMLLKQKNVVSRKYNRQSKLFAYQDFKKEQDSLKSILSEALNKIDYDYCASHPQSYLTAWLVQEHIKDLTLDSLTMFYNNLSEDLKNNIIGQNIAGKTLQKKSALIGTKAPGFSTIDVKEKPLTLYSFSGKYVLLDFWASWCKPCRENSPQIINLYNEYNKRGLEIIGISSDNNAIASWKKAINKDGTGKYYHILNGMDRDARSQGIYNDKDIGMKYGVGVLPTMILINPEGIIIGRYEDIGSLTRKIKSIFD